MIFIACGTHHQPFDRLVRAADRLAEMRNDEPVFVQTGSSTVNLRHARGQATLEPSDFAACLDSARIVVLHGGSSSFLEAQRLGRKPIVVPRSVGFSEHVDDHQWAFARSLGDAVVIATPETLVHAIAVHAETRSVPRPTDAVMRVRAWLDGLSRRTGSVG